MSFTTPSNSHKVICTGAKVLHRLCSGSFDLICPQVLEILVKAHCSNKWSFCT